MTETPADAPPGTGNRIVPTPTTIKDIPFPMLLLASLVVGAGIFYVAKFDTKAGWLLAFIILLAIAFAHPNFSDELTTLLKTATPNAPTSAVTGGANGVVVGPTGPISGG